MQKLTRGFTLIELLVAMSLLATIMLLGNWSFSVFTQKWQGRLGHFAQTVSQSKDFILLADIVSAIVPYVYRQNQQLSYYFSGDRQGFSAVTLGSIFHPKAAANFQLQVKQHANGTWYLLYQEGQLATLTEQSANRYSHEKILIAKGQELYFEYFGWQSALEKINGEDLLSSNSRVSATWHETYQSSATSLMPIAIRIHWDGEVIELPLLNDQGQWLTILVNSGGLNE